MHIAYNNSIMMRKPDDWESVSRRLRRTESRTWQAGDKNKQQKKIGQQIRKLFNRKHWFQISNLKHWCQIYRKTFKKHFRPLKIRR